MAVTVLNHAKQLRGWTPAQEDELVAAYIAARAGGLRGKPLLWRISADLGRKFGAVKSRTEMLGDRIDAELAAAGVAPIVRNRPGEVAGSMWCEADDRVLLAMVAEGATNAAIAARLGRSVAGIKRRVNLLRSRSVPVAVRAPVAPKHVQSWSDAEQAVLAQMVPAGADWGDVVAAVSAAGGVQRSLSAVKCRAVNYGMRRPVGGGARVAKALRGCGIADYVPAPKPAPAPAPVVPMVRQVIVAPVVHHRLTRAMTAHERDRVLAAHLAAVAHPAWSAQADLALARVGLAGGGFAAMAAAARMPEPAARARWAALVAVFDGMADRGLPVEAAALLLPALAARADAGEVAA